MAGGFDELYEKLGSQFFDYWAGFFETPWNHAVANRTVIHDESRQVSRAAFEQKRRNENRAKICDANNSKYEALTNSYSTKSDLLDIYIYQYLVSLEDEIGPDADRRRDEATAFISAEPEMARQLIGQKKREQVQIAIANHLEWQARRRLN